MLGGPIPPPEGSRLVRLADLEAILKLLPPPPFIKDGFPYRYEVPNAHENIYAIRAAFMEMLNAAPATELERYVPDIVKNAMLVAWREICEDTGCHPLDIEHGKNKHLTFQPRHWAQLAGEIVRTQIGRFWIDLK
jgi:hypothetical protein